MDVLSRTTAGPNGCFVWTGATSNGYGQLRMPGTTRLDYAHRVAYRQHVGPIPPGFQVDHVRARGCMGGRCVRPDHLEAVPPKVNRTRVDSPQGRAELTGVCARGHDRTDPANLYVHRDGTRECRLCKQQRRRERRGLL